MQKAHDSLATGVTYSGKGRNSLDGSKPFAKNSLGFHCYNECSAFNLDAYNNFTGGFLSVYAEYGIELTLCRPNP